MMHLIRKAISQDCTVCAALSFEPCILPPETDRIGRLEFEILAAARNLRELAPGHALVKMLEVGLD